MLFFETNLKGSFEIEFEPIWDKRGSFSTTFSANEFKIHGLETKFVQANTSYNFSKGTWRGLHYQTEPHAEVKLVRCIRGAIYDVMVDLRQDSFTYCKWFGTELTAENCKMLYIPKHFAHGYLTLSDDVEVFYMMSSLYHSQSATGAKYNDPAFNIKLPFEPTIISERDLEHQVYVK